MSVEATVVTPLRQQHLSLGASMGRYFDCELPERYVELLGECRTGRECVAVFDLGYYGVLKFSGPDRFRFLNAVTTNNIRDLAPGQGNLGLLLNPKGHILAELLVIALPDCLLAFTHASVIRRTAEILEKHIIMDDVVLEAVSEDYALLGIEGPKDGAALQALGCESLASLLPGSHTAATINSVPVRIIRHSSFGELGAAVLVPRDQAGTIWRSLLAAAREHQGGPIGYAALNALRLEARIPWFSYDFDDTVIPHEARLEHTHISYSKGCYTGQEIVERVRARGHVHRVRVPLQFLGLDVPPAGTPLLVAGNPIGHVTSAAFSPLLGRVLGMGYVRREHSEPGTLLQWSQGEAEVA